MSSSGVSTKSDFLLAEEIKSSLQGRDKGEQERIVRWVCESLGLAANLPFSARISEGHVSGAAIPQAAVGSSVTSSRTPDIRSFVQEKQPKNDIQFVAVVAYFHRFMAPEGVRKDVIKSDDLQDAARLAPRHVFNNPLGTLNNSVKQGYLDRSAPGEFRLNAVGENLVSMTLPGVGAGNTAGTAKPGKRPKKQGPKRRQTKKTRKS